MKKRPHALSAVSRLATLALLATAACHAGAQSAGSNVLSLGWFHFGMRDSSSPLSFSQPSLGAVPGSGASVGDANTGGLSYTHFFTNHFALALDVGAPPKFNLNGSGTLAPLGHLGSAQQWSPALVAKWFFGEANDRLRPFAGVGAAYVWYDNVTLSPSLAGEVTGGAPGGAASADLSSSWAPVADLGFTYALDKNWSIGFSVSYLPLKTDADITGRVGDTVVSRSSTRLTLDPVVSFLSIGYRF